MLTASFSVLLWSGQQIYQQAPPMPEQVRSEDGSLIYTRQDIELGRQVWQSMGGMQLGSIWGHGSYVAPDWSADWLHRELVTMLDNWAQEDFAVASFEALTIEQQAALQSRLQSRVRRNSYDPDTAVITVDTDRAQAIAEVSAHYESLFGNDSALAELRENYAMRNNTVADAGHRRNLAAFFWWAAWATATERPDSDISYTSNWPSEPLVGNRPPPSTFLWSAFSVTILLMGIGLLGWHYAVTRDSDEDQSPALDSDPLKDLRPSPSMLAVGKYFWVLLALFLAQILLGAITAHYQVEGQDFYGLALSEILPYSITRTSAYPVSRALDCCRLVGHRAVYRPGPVGL